MRRPLCEGSPPPRFAGRGGGGGAFQGRLTAPAGTKKPGAEHAGRTVTGGSERLLMFARPARAQHAIAAHTPAVLRLDAQRAVVAAPAPGVPVELQVEGDRRFADVGRGAVLPVVEPVQIQAGRSALAIARGPVRLHGRGFPAPRFHGTLVHRGPLTQGDPAAWV